MSTTGVIAWNTFQEAVRRRVFLIILIFGMISIGISNFFSFMSTGEEEKFITDFGLGSILLAGMLISVFLGASLIPSEIERKTIFTILAKPVDRLHFILGKFFGIILTVFVNVFMMGLVFLIFYYAKQHHKIDAHLGLSIMNLTKALILVFFELVVLSSIAVAVSVMASSVAFNIVLTMFIYFAGHISSSFQHLIEHTDQAWVAGMLKVTYFFIPKLDNFDIREKLLMGDPVSWSYMFPTLGNAVIFILVAILLGYLFFYDKEF